MLFRREFLRNRLRAWRKSLLNKITIYGSERPFPRSNPSDNNWRDKNLPTTPRQVATRPPRETAFRNLYLSVRWRSRGIREKESSEARETKAEGWKPFAGGRERVARKRAKHELFSATRCPEAARILFSTIHNALSIINRVRGTQKRGENKARGSRSWWFLAREREEDRALRRNLEDVWERKRELIPGKSTCPVESRSHKSSSDDRSVCDPRYRCACRFCRYTRLRGVALSILPRDSDAAREKEREREKPDRERGIIGEDVHRLFSGKWGIVL